MKLFSTPLRLCGFVLLLALAALAQTIPAPKETLGFTPGDDRKLASWAQVIDYFQKLDAASDRVVFQEIGKTTVGAPFVYATISSPENLKDLEKYKQINAKLADPRLIGTRTLLSATDDASSAVKGKGDSGLAGGTGVADKSVRAPSSLINQGKTIVLITCGIHSTEVGSYLSSMLIAHKLASSNDPEIANILDNTIILLVPSLNPDGVDIVKNWYDKTLGTPYEGTDPPELYHKYVGHDDNRDWYAFTQVETQLTVDKIHNVWHPQIVHDIHQQGANGSRLFLPPYMQPVEPNVPKQIVEGYTELGNYMAGELRKKGLVGITTNSTYDAWTPSRAYSHYHGGVRILSETASCKLATPINVKFEDLRVSSDDGYDPKKESDKFGPLWKGGEWRLSNITDYMTTTAFTLLNHAANNREQWLTRFYEIGKEAVRPRNEGEVRAYVLPFDPKAVAKEQDKALDKGDFDLNLRLNPSTRFAAVIEILERGGVEVDEPNRFEADSVKYPKGTAVISMAQPYAAFAKALLEPQKYPDLLDAAGHPIAPYDVTAHTLSLLAGIDARPVTSSFRAKLRSKTKRLSYTCECRSSPTYAIYRSAVPSMDEGWTRWIVNGTENYKPCCGEFKSISTGDIREDKLSGMRAIVFPDQPPAQILNGYPKGTMPDEYTGGVGKEGVENLRKFVEAGGTLVFLNRASDFAIDQFKLPVKDVTRGLARKDFYIPGSILRTELDTIHPIAKGMPKESIAWFEGSPAFEIMTDPPAAGVSSPTVREGSTPDGSQRGALTNLRATDTVSVRVIARYPSDPKQILLSGWALGTEKIAGKAALVEFTIGKGKIILFGFRPQYRGQSLATFPLFFNAISR